MGPSNHQVLNSTIRSCYFVTTLLQEARKLIGLELEWRLFALVRIICNPSSSSSSSSFSSSYSRILSLWLPSQEPMMIYEDGKK